MHRNPFCFYFYSLLSFCLRSTVGFAYLLYLFLFLGGGGGIYLACFIRLGARGRQEMSQNHYTNDQQEPSLRAPKAGISQSIRKIKPCSEYRI